MEEQAVSVASVAGGGSVQFSVEANEFNPSNSPLGTRDSQFVMTPQRRIYTQMRPGHRAVGRYCLPSQHMAHPGARPIFFDTETDTLRQTRETVLENPSQAYGYVPTKAASAQHQQQHNKRAQSHSNTRRGGSSSRVGGSPTMSPGMTASGPRKGRTPMLSPLATPVFPPIPENSAPVFALGQPAHKSYQQQQQQQQHRRRTESSRARSQTTAAATAQIPPQPNQKSPTVNADGWNVVTNKRKK